MQNDKPLENHLIEQIISDFLKEREIATVDEIYSTCRNNVPFYLLKEVIFNMYKEKVLRRKVIKGIGAHYCLSAMLPKYGTPYLPRKPGKKNLHKKEMQALTMMESVRVCSKVYMFDQLLRNVRE